jgi:RNA polymerase sigma factor (sigma-70 family)
MVEAADTRTDEQLMSAYAAGDRAAFQALFDRYAALLFAMARRRLSSEDDARDVVQQTLLQLHRARHDYRPGAPFRPWLFTIALNLVREQYRKRKRRKEHGLEGTDAPPEAASAPEVEALDEHRVRAARVRAALASLPDQQREVIELHWFEESPYDEIAKILGASVAAVRVRAHRGYERLRQILPDLGNNS